MRTIAITMSDGSLSMMALGDGVDPAAEVTRIPGAVSWREVLGADLPAERAYADAWRDTGTAIVHDMAKAREIHRSRLRQERALFLAQYDAEYPHADAVTQARLDRIRQRLLDVPADPRITRATTAEALAAVQIDLSILE